MAKKTDFDDEMENEGVAGADFENAEDGLVVNLSEVEAQKFEVLPKGKYNIVVADNQYSLSKSSGKPMWNMQLSIVDEGEFKNRRLFTFLSFSEKALGNTKGVLSVIAPELADKTDLRINDPETVASVIGRFAKVSVDIQKADPEQGYDESNRVKRWFQPDASAAFG